MAELTTVAAAVLGVLLGGVLITFPDPIIRLQTAGRLPQDRRGEYGTHGTPPERWRRLAQGVGVLLLLAGIYFGYTAVVA